MKGKKTLVAVGIGEREFDAKHAKKLLKVKVEGKQLWKEKKENAANSDRNNGNPERDQTGATEGNSPDAAA